MIAGSLLVGLIAVAAALYFSASPQLPSASSYTGYEPVLREWFALNRIEVKKVKHLAGPFYAIRYSTSGKAQRCVMVDVSTQYKGNRADQEFDAFWYTAGVLGFADKNGGEHAICDF